MEKGLFLHLPAKRCKEKIAGKGNTAAQSDDAIAAGDVIFRQEIQ